MKHKQLNFQNQKLIVDYMAWNVQKSDYNEKSFAKFFFDLGFNSYRKSAKFKATIPQTILENEQNLHQVVFEIDQLYWNGTRIVLSGLNAARFYFLAKENIIDWKIFDTAVLGRFDLYFSQKIKPSKETLLNFFHRCQEKLNVTTGCEINSKGTILRIGSRRSGNYARIYEKENFLRFEYEMKNEVIEKYSTLLMTKDFLEFESQLTQNFIAYFGKNLPLDSSYTPWLAKKLRPFRQGSQSSLTFQSSLTLKTDSMESMNIRNLQDEKVLALFLQFLIYIRDLDFKQEFLGSTSYRCIRFEVQNFFEFENPSATSSTYRFQKLKAFIESLQTNFRIQKFSDSYFQSLASIPQVEFIKSNKKMIAQIWVVEDLFHYTYPFQFPNVLNGKLSKHQFSVASNLITTFSSENIEKRFNIKEFLQSYSFLTNQDSKKIKEHFINYIQLLLENDLIENKVFVIRDNMSYPVPVTELKTSDISDGFRLYEKLHF